MTPDAQELRLRETIENSRHWLEETQRKAAEGSDGSEIAFQRGLLAKDLFALGRYYHGAGSYAEAIPYIQEAVDLARGHSVESAYILADCLSRVSRWDDAYAVFLSARGVSAAGRKHPLYDDPDLVFDALGGLPRRCMDNCSRLQQPVVEEEYQNWHWSKRFRDLGELRAVAERYHPRGKELAIVYHPFAFARVERITEFAGLTERGVPFAIEEKPPMLVGSPYRAKAKYVVTNPQSESGVEDAISYLVLNLLT